MIRFRNKLFLAFTFLAFSLFLSVSLGGEFLHHRIHHHENKASHDDCPVYQLLAQAFLFVIAAVVGLQEACIDRTAVVNEIFISRQQYLLPSLRAPPVSL